MPLTQLQADVLRVVSALRDERSYVAGSMVLNADPASLRYSRDLDVFHDAAVDVAQHSERDLAALRAAGFQAEPAIGTWDRPSTFRRALVRRGDAAVEIDWAVDGAYRFFPILTDPVLGRCLHLFDMATNKALALSARSESRDLIDIVEVSRRYSLEAICWAACGKDAGFTPLSLLKLMRRFAVIHPEDVEKLQARALDPRQIKMTWIDLADRAEAEMTRIADDQPDLPIGVAFVDERCEPGWIGANPALRLHAPSVRGCWPEVRAVPPG